MSLATIVLFICYADLFPQENVFNDVRNNGQWAVFDLSEKISNKDMLRRVCAVINGGEFGKCFLLLNPNHGVTLRDFYVKSILSKMNFPLTIYYPPHCYCRKMEFILRKMFFTGQQVVVSNEKDLAMVKRYIGNGIVELK